MTTKLVKDLEVGDVVKLVEPDGAARITSKERSRLFQSPGGCFRLDMRVTDGPNKGNVIRDQHHGGEQTVELA